VMGFCTEEQCKEFFRSVPEFERMLRAFGHHPDQVLVSITDEEQQFRFLIAFTTRSSNGS
jgi:polyphosphate kinase